MTTAVVHASMFSSMRAAPTAHAHAHAVRAQSAKRPASYDHVDYKKDDVKQYGVAMASVKVLFRAKIGKTVRERFGYQTARRR